MEQTPTVTPGRPRSFDEGRVLDAALELFWQQGYRGTSTRQLEVALGLSQSSLYNAFGSKHGLLAAALDRYEARLDAELLRPLEYSDQGLGAIDAFLDALAHWVTHDGRRGCMIINLMAEDGGASDAITQRTRAYRQRVRTALRGSLERAARLGETDEGSLDARAEMLFGLVLGLNIAARGGAARSEIDGLLAAAHHAVAGWQLAAG